MIGDEVYITELEAEVLSVFVKRAILKDQKIIGTLEMLIEKLETVNGNAGAA